MEEEREEGEIVDLNDDDIYENIISSDEVDEDDIRQRIEELEAKNSELEKIASISKTHDYDLGCGSSNYIDLVNDDNGEDDESYYRQPSKYDYSSYTSSRKRSRSRRRKACRHECKKYKRHKPYKTERRKKTQPRTRDSGDTSSDDAFQLDRNKLQAALKRNTSSINSSSLKRKLIGVSKTVEDFLKAKEDVADEDISTRIEIMHLLNKITNDKIVPENTASISEEETESCLDEQELRMAALKSAIIKKAEARKKRKIIETQPYSPTDTNIVLENVIVTNASSKTKDELVNMEISPAVSPTIQDGSLQPIDMELESEDESQRVAITNNQQEVEPLSSFSKPVDIVNIASKDLQNSINVPVPEIMSLSTANVPEETNQTKSLIDSSQQRKQQEEEEEHALRESLLAELKASKKIAPSNKTQVIQTPLEDSLPLDKSLSDAASEAEHLRKQVFSSIQKRRNRQLLPNPFAQKFTVPKPMEMTMPQITSNLKEALKRIKERDKQNVEADIAPIDNIINVGIAVDNRNINSDSGTSKETKVIVHKSKKVQPESNDSKKTAVKLNGDNVSLKATVKKLTIVERKPTIVEKKPTIVEKKPTIVEKKPTIVEKKPTIVEKNPIIVEKKPTELISKSNVVLKNVTCNNSSLETKTKDPTVPLVISNKIETGLLDKSDIALRSLKTIVHKKVITEPHISLNQKENQELRKAIVSPKRVSEEKLLAAKKIKLNNVKVSRVITTPVEKTVKKMIIQLNNSDTESDDLGLEQNNIDAIANDVSYSGVASPASYTFSPSSPSNVTDTKSSDAIPTTTDSFQRKLDEYLKSARTKVEQTKLEKPKPIKKSPSLVSHLPPSSQLEYRKLINRMALLERQKLLKMSKLTVVVPKPSSSISVTINNDLFNNQPKSDDEILPLNGKLANSTKEFLENCVTGRSVQLDIPKENIEVACISTANVIVDCRTKCNNLDVSEMRVQPNKDAIIESTSVEKSTNNLRNFSALSDYEKSKFLLTTESEYMDHSKLYLVDLNNMSLLVNQARQEKEKQFQMESEIEELESKIRQLQEQLVKQKLSVSKLYPVISASHKNIMQKRSRSLQLNKKCYYVGSNILGANYKITDDPKAEIAQKVKSLSSETKLLRNMKKPVESEVSTSMTSINSEGKHLREEFVNHTTAAESATIGIFSRKPADVSPPSVNCTLDIPKPLSKMIKYKSPLDHMNNIGITNPDSIVCPFQLLGQCEDKECTYQHLS